MHVGSNFSAIELSSGTDGGQMDFEEFTNLVLALVNVQFLREGIVFLNGRVFGVGGNDTLQIQLVMGTDVLIPTLLVDGLSKIFPGHCY